MEKTDISKKVDNLNFKEVIMLVADGFQYKTILYKSKIILDNCSR